MRFQQRNSSFYPAQSQRSRFSGKRNQPKQLNASLFVKKAEPLSYEVPQTQNARFSDFRLDEKIHRNIREHNYVTPSPIQEQAIPYIIEGRDVIGIANTGTGKTAAFLIPLINKAFHDRNERVLIVTPTRELAVQIADEFISFAKGTGLEHVLCIGGVSIDRQERNLRHNPHFVIGTPGRLKDVIGRNTLHLNLYRNVVLDEADRMVDIGFIKDIKYLISLLPPKRQSLFFSATLTDSVKSIIQQFVTNPITVSVKKQETAAHIEQDIIKVSNRDEKAAILQDLLRREGFDKVLVFGRTKWGVEKLSKLLIRNGFRAAAIHGNKSQGQRQRVLDQFKKQQLQVLLATDVASRGLDIEDVTHVINYDAPSTYEDYVHRIGRTGRANKKGIALTFVE